MLVVVHEMGVSTRLESPAVAGRRGFGIEMSAAGMSMYFICMCIE